MHVPAIFAATVSAFVLGGLWYSPWLFGAAWQRASGVTDETLKTRSQSRVLSIAFLLTLVMAANLAAFLNEPTTTMSWGATAGFLAGFGWAALSIAVVSLFESRPLSYILINGGYVTAALVLMGAIIGGWR